VTISATMRSFRLGKLEAGHLKMYNLLTSSPQSLTKLATTAGVSLETAEHQCGSLCDEGLAVRTLGDRTTSMYQVSS